MAADGDLVERLDEQVVALSGTDPEADLEDLQPLAPLFADRTVVGLGEATHGTREFFRLKHRLVRYLVREQGVRLVGIEANFPETTALDEYVADGVGDPATALGDVTYWTWDTEEMVALLRWLRAFNEDRPPDDRVRLHGFDARSAQAAAEELRAFLRRTDPPAVEAAGDAFETLSTTAPTDAVTEEWLLAADAVATDLADRFEERAATYREATTEREWRRVRHLREVVAQARDLGTALTVGNVAPDAVRDEQMAENVAWLLAHEDADRAVVLAHNGHVKTGRFRARGGGDDAPETMGQHLRSRYGDGYYALGFEFGRGSFRALPDPDEEGSGSLQSFTVDRGPDGAVPGVLSAVDGEICLLDVETAAGDPRVGEWLREDHPLHNVGSVHVGEEAAFVPVELATEYDGLLFVAETTAARPA